MLLAVCQKSVPSKYVVFPLCYHHFKWLNPHHSSWFCLCPIVETVHGSSSPWFSLPWQPNSLVSQIRNKLFASYLQMVTGALNCEGIKELPHLAKWPLTTISATPSLIIFSDQSFSWFIFATERIAVLHSSLSTWRTRRACQKHHLNQPHQ